MKTHTYFRRTKKLFTKTARSALALTLAVLILLTTFTVAINIFSADAATLGEGQTKFSSISAFQKDRWAKLQAQIFNDTTGDAVVPNTQVAGKTVRASNGIFDWVSAEQLPSASVWSGSNSGTAPTASTYTQIYNYGGTNVEYTVYDIATADEFRYVLANLETLTPKYIKVNLTTDLNMDGNSVGSDGKPNKVWNPIDTKYCIAENYQKYLYLEGNGHTIYNLRISTTDIHTGAGIFSRPPAFMVMKNFGFRSSMVINAAEPVPAETDWSAPYFRTAGLISAFAPQKFYFYNIHTQGGYYQVTDASGGASGIGGLIGRKNINPASFGITGRTAFLTKDIGDAFIKNCSTSDCYMYGADHIGGLTSWFGCPFQAKDCKYNTPFPDTPENYVIVGNESISKSTTLEDMKSLSHYPIMIENCSSTDCEIFSTGHDSGALISCGRGLLVRNSYTNNKIYAIDSTGGFIGRVASDEVDTNAAQYVGGYIKDDYDRFTISSYFENCYSSGVVEGKEAMGGFIGLENSSRSRSEIYKKVDNPTVNRGSTAFVNCYSTAMVGMDYAGKYCGGFIGMDDNYNDGTVIDGNVYLPEITVNNLNDATGNTKVSGRGNFYINCYAAGEVGNILTVTDIEKAKDKDKYYLTLSNPDCEGDDTADKILDYYPTGGFIGALGIDKAYDENGNYVDNNGYGTFHNCYYDMQTTAMHEMAVGLANVRTSRDSAPSGDFQLTGVTGLYTEDSETKSIPGLTGEPQDYTKTDGETVTGKKFAMDNGGNQSGVWKYNSQYYPQLSVFMTTDTKLDNIQARDTTDPGKDAANKQQLQIDVAEAVSSKFYIPVKNYYSDAGNGCTCSEDNNDCKIHQSNPVYSVADSNSGVNATVNSGELSTTATYAAQLAGVVRAFRYSQASTSTVLLDHWDATMDTKSGTVGAENDWKTNVTANKMTSKTVTDPDTGKEITEWSVSYQNVQAGNYEFKVTTPNWNFNYGVGGSQGENMTLKVPEDGCNVTIRFYCSKPKSTDFYVKADITRPSGDTYTDTLAEGNEYIETPYTVAGSFSGWNASQNVNYTMTHTGDRENYSLTINGLTASETPYYFKITDGAGWTNNWGLGGTFDGQDMSFVLTGTADVTIVFNEITHICTVTADPAENIKNISTLEKVIDFEGYSAVFSDALFTGHYWLDKDSDKVKEACQDGALTYNSETGMYERVFDVTIKNDTQINANYAYKIIKDAEDKGTNRRFHIDNTVKVGDTLQVKITYNPNTNDSTIESLGSTALGPKAKAAESYSVIGAAELTGHNWMSLEAAESGKMTAVTGSTTVFEKIYTDVPKGQYAFKIVADCIENGGTWGSGIDWGGADNSNYFFELSDTANVRIIFDSNQEKIIIDSDKLVESKWVLTGAETLMGSYGNWNKKAPLMTYNSETGLYELEIKNVSVNSDETEPKDGATETPNYNYSCKVVEYDNDKGEDNVVFVLNKDVQIQYDLKFEYDEVYKTLNITAYDAFGVDVTDKVISYSVTPYFYSVLGSENLTHDPWGTRFPAQAAYDGWMNIEKNGVYEKSYEITIPNDGNAELYSFKVAANGTFGSGLSWGDKNGENIIVSVASTKIDKTTITIYFDSNTKEVSYTLADPEVDQKYSGDDLTWFVAGTYTLRSNNGYKVRADVYDTVRDITADFTFTSGDNSAQKGVLWSKDLTSNESYGFKNSLSFDLDYSQTSGGKLNEINTTFNSDIIDLSVEAIGAVDTPNPAEKLVAKFGCSYFMPGKQWLTVTTAGYGYSSAYNDWKTKYLKYAVYSEKLKYYNEKLSQHLSAISGIKFVNGDTTVTIKDETTLLMYLTKYPQAATELANRFNLGNGITLLDLKTELDGYEDNHYNEKPGDTPNFGETAIVGSRNLRLIPTAYLEAGNDARVEIRQSENDRKGDNVTNTVKYYTDDKAQTVLKVKDDNGNLVENKIIDETEFNYYNLAVTAGYLITDRVGLGIYSNYNDQYVAQYNNTLLRDDSQNDVRNSNADGSGAAHRYYAMKSAYNNTRQWSVDENGNRTYTEELSAGTYTDKGSRTTANLTIQNFVSQSTIGTSYKNGTDYAQTIVKVYKLIYEDDGTVRRELVNMDSDPNATNDNAVAYQKWSGTKNFTSADKGDYVVKFCWTLSDGRYLESEKNVTILVYEPNISLIHDPKYDGETHIEYQKSTPADESETPTVISSKVKNDNTITYRIKYSNEKISSNLTFAVLDILPFDKSIRTDRDFNGKTVSYTNNMPKTSNFTLKNIKLLKSNETTTIKGFYYTTVPANENVTDIRKWDTADAAVATNLKLTYNNTDNQAGYIDSSLIYDKDSNPNGMFHSFPKIEGKDELGYQPNIVRECNIQNITGLAVTGVELAMNESIEIEFDVEYNGYANDLIINSANYHAISPDIDVKGTADQSSIVSTTIVTRNLAGYAWLDGNTNGLFDEGEKCLKNMRVHLYNIVDGKPVDTDIPDVVTDATGYYEFKNLPEGTYSVRFLKPLTGKIEDTDGNEVTYETLDLTKTMTERDTETKYDEETKKHTKSTIGSANLAVDATAYGGESDFRIPKIELPKNDNVGKASYSQRSATSLNYIQEDNTFIYNKMNMNAGFTTKVERNISGYAWLDKNQNGYVDNGEEPLEGVVVKLYQNGKQVDSVPSYTTGNNGYYEFTDVPVQDTGNPGDGKFEIRFTAPNGYIVKTQSGEEIDFRTLQMNNPITETQWSKNQFEGTGNIATGIKSDNYFDYASARVTLPTIAQANDEQFRTDNSLNRYYEIQDGVMVVTASPINAGMYYGATRRVSGYAWLDVNQNGYAEDGEPPLEGVVVSLYQNGNQVNFVQPYTTGGDGYYEFEDIPVQDNGTFEIRFSAPEGGTVKTSDGNITFGKLKMNAPVTEVQWSENQLIGTGSIATGVKDGSSLNYAWARVKLPTTQDAVSGKLPDNISLNRYYNRTDKGVNVFTASPINAGFGIAPPDLPKAGGNGIFNIILGGISAVLLAGVLFFIKKRRTRKNNI